MIYVLNTLRRVFMALAVHDKPRAALWCAAAIRCARCLDRKHDQRMGAQ